MKYSFILCLWVSTCSILLAQSGKRNSNAIDTSILQSSGKIIEMPYNRLIQSAGKAISYGNPELENHTLDITLLGDKTNLVTEDRYGIAVINGRTGIIADRWDFGKSELYKNIMSTYSGITSFLWNNTTYICWGAASSSKSFLMIAEWDGKQIKNVKGMKLDALSPAKLALPNQVAIHFESNIPYIYLVLNGNNQLLKVRFSDQQLIWSVNTSIAPFGLCIVGKKAYVTNWGGPIVTDSSKENAGTPWGTAYTNPETGGTGKGSISVMDITTGKQLNEIETGLHPNAIIYNKTRQALYIANANDDNISVLDIEAEKVVETIQVGLFSKSNFMYGSSPNALQLLEGDSTLLVANGMDNALAVVALGNKTRVSRVTGYIPTEAYPSGIALFDQNIFVTNLEAKGASILSNAKYEKEAIMSSKGEPMSAYSIHKQLASFSIIPIPDSKQLSQYTKQVLNFSMQNRINQTSLLPRKGILPVPIPERIGEPSVFKHVIYIIKENKTYDQVFGDLKEGRGEQRLCIYGDSITPNQHQLAKDFMLLDNYYASGKSSAEGHQWTDAAMVSDYIEKNVRAWFRSYPHRQEDALVYNKKGFIWNNALDHGKKVRIYGEACTSHYDEKLKWLNLYTKRIKNETIGIKNTSTIARIRPIISPDYPDCDNINLPDQLRADVFIKEWKAFEQLNGDQLPDLLVLSLPNDHTAGTSPNFPVPSAMVADNDLALGRIIETITHSRFWDSTVIFITEDDSQSGWDHISSYRTTGLVLSAYSILHKSIHTKYNQTSMVRSIEQILGIPPMNVIDATALPLFDCFRNTKSTYQFSYIPNKVPLDEMNKPFASLRGKALNFAKLSANSAYKEIDGGNDDMMNKILWYYAKGEETYPNNSVNKNK